MSMTMIHEADLEVRAPEDEDAPLEWRAPSA